MHACKNIVRTRAASTPLCVPPARCLSPCQTHREPSPVVKVFSAPCSVAMRICSRAASQHEGCISMSKQSLNPIPNRAIQSHVDSRNLESEKLISWHYDRTLHTPKPCRDTRAQMWTHRREKGAQHTNAPTKLIWSKVTFVVVCARVHGTVILS